MPLPEVSTDHLEVIAEGLLRAFGDIRARCPVTVASGTEAEVTALMEARLNILIEEDPLWGQLVLCAVRGKESISFNGAHLEKRPDLSIYLSNRNRGFPLITEAKIIDAVSSKTEVLYCDNGIRRLVDGEYAWGNREAFMIAYVRDGSSIRTKLTPFLSGAIAKKPQEYLIESLPTAVDVATSDLTHSRHGRNFSYEGGASAGIEPGPISVWHLWLS
ncbi:MAG: hypothetical protein EOR16_35710 [Mesorhizobium sp.]|nr:MAG: hypothetical protein EOR16_35710 [Mesorhizobium sp.]